MAVRAIRDSGGCAVRVSDAQIIAAIPQLGRETGVFVEPAAAAAYAGLLKLAESGMIKADERVLLVLTGNGLKDVEAAKRAVGAPMRVAPGIEISDLELRIAEIRKQTSPLSTIRRERS